MNTSPVAIRRWLIPLFSGVFVFGLGDCLQTAAGADGSGNRTRTTDEDEQSDGPLYRFGPRKHRFGTGKYYMGREIAPVVGHAEIRWIERPQRSEQENLPLLIKSLKLKPGMVVADIGAGSGVISLLMAEEVKPDGRVLAVDIQKAMLDRLRRKLEKRGIENVVPHRGAEKSPRLEPNSVDLALMVDVYHELQFPHEMMLAISKAVKPGGRVVLVEYRKEDPEVPIKPVHKMTEAQVKKELSRPEFGLKWKKTVDKLPWQHVVVFERVPENER